VQRLGGFYVQQHNSAMFHSAFRGPPPDEWYFGTERVALAHAQLRNVL
jgi:hypothetical protein